MNTTTLKAKWQELSGKIKQKYAVLTDDDLKLLEGKEEEMWGRLQQKIGKKKEEIMTELEQAGR